MSCFPWLRFWEAEEDCSLWMIVNFLSKEKQCKSGRKVRSSCWMATWKTHIPTWNSYIEPTSAHGQNRRARVNVKQSISVLWSKSSCTVLHNLWSFTGICCVHASWNFCFPYSWCWCDGWPQEVMGSTPHQVQNLCWDYCSIRPQQTEV